MKHKQAGIYKGVSVAVYPDDILADQELQGAPLDVRGAWTANVLEVMWRDKVWSVTATPETFARRWGTDVAHANRIIDDIESHKIGDVVRKSNGDVTLICRRLQRMEEYRVRTKERVQKHRCNTDVTAVEALPPSPSSLSSPSSVPVDVGETPPPAVSGAGIEMGLKMVVDAFCAKTRWVGPRERVYEEFRALLQDYDGGTLSAKVQELAFPGMKPWAFAEKMRAGGKHDGAARREAEESERRFREAERWDRENRGKIKDTRPLAEIVAAQAAAIQKEAREG